MKADDPGVPTPEDVLDRAYSHGSNRAWLTMLRDCLRHLDAESSEAATAKWAAERTEVVLALRTICEEFGDNDWPDDLYLPDVIEKHLARNLR